MTHHPDVHEPARQWAEDQTLHVAVAYSNPFRWRTRRELANDFRRHLAQTPNVELHFAELAYGDRPFEVTGGFAGDLRFRTRTELFHKENILNLAVRHFPEGWKYGAVIDADFHFTRHDWALEAVHQLQHHEWVQLFSAYTNVSGKTTPGSGHRPIGTSNGFAFNFVTNGCQLPARYGGYGTAPLGSPGGAWAFRRESFDAVGGLLDRCILGSGDWFMALGLAGEDFRGRDKDIPAYSVGYRDYVTAWADRAKAVHRNVGFVDQHAIHHFHGPMNRRGYESRDSILIRNQFDPSRDVYPDWQGVLQLAPEKHRLRDDVRRYFLSRSEDLPQPT